MIKHYHKPNEEEKMLIKKRAFYDRVRDNYQKFQNYLDFSNDGDSHSRAHLEYYLRTLSDSSKVSKDLLNRSRKYKYIFFTEKMLWKLAYDSAQINMFLIQPFKTSSPNEAIKSCIKCQTTPAQKKSQPMEIVDDGWVPDPNGVKVNNLVEFIDTNSGESYCFTIVGTNMSDIDKKQIALDTPVGKSLLGHIPGDIVLAETGIGKRKFKITNIIQ